MGGGFYQDDVGEAVRSTPSSYFQHSARVAAAAPQDRKAHPTLDPKGKVRECCDTAEHPATTPVAVLFDLTESRGEDTEVVCKKLPSMIGQIKMNDYVPDPELCFIGVGDATFDRASLQVGQFESDSRLDNHLRNLWIEKGGGGTGQESYQNAAYFLARRTRLSCWERGKKGVAFFLGDEGFYPQISPDEVRDVLGTVPGDGEGDGAASGKGGPIPSAQIFREMQEKYDAYFIYPRKTWEERKANIDNEIRQRVTKAGGMIEGVDVRFSLMWNNRNDLDLHVQTPEGFHIFFRQKQSPCGGFLDVDMNVHGETTKPVENVRWAKGTAKPGVYRAWVENFRFHEPSLDATEFKMEVEVAGQVTHFEGKTPHGATANQSAVVVGEFTYDPSKQAGGPPTDHYAAYDDQKILAQWQSVLPPERILRIGDPKACVDIMLGVLALTSGSRDLEGYTKDLVTKGQTPQRIEEVRAALANLAEVSGAARVKLGAIPAGAAGLPQRKSQSQRL